MISLALTSYNLSVICVDGAFATWCAVSGFGRHGCIAGVGLSPWIDDYPLILERVGFSIAPCVQETTGKALHGYVCHARTRRVAEPCGARRSDVHQGRHWPRRALSHVASLGNDGLVGGVRHALLGAAPIADDVGAVVRLLVRDDDLASRCRLHTADTVDARARRAVVGHVAAVIGDGALRLGAPRSARADGRRARARGGRCAALAALSAARGHRGGCSRGSASCPSRRSRAAAPHNQKPHRQDFAPHLAEATGFSPPVNGD